MDIAYRSFGSPVRSPWMLSPGAPGNGFSVSQGRSFNPQLRTLNAGAGIYNDVMELSGRCRGALRESVGVSQSDSAHRDRDPEYFIDEYR
jgi:hypothetical protein